VVRVAGRRAVLAVLALLAMVDDDAAVLDVASTTVCVTEYAHARFIPLHPWSPSTSTHLSVHEATEVLVAFVRRGHPYHNRPGASPPPPPPPAPTPTGSSGE